jgi:hypothetical protein
MSLPLPLERTSRVRLLFAIAVALPVLAVARPAAAQFFDDAAPPPKPPSPSPATTRPPSPSPAKSAPATTTARPPVAAPPAAPPPFVDPFAAWDDDPKPFARRSDHLVVVHGPTAPEHLAPLIKLSYRRFNLPNLDGSDMTMNGAQIDMYGLSRKWFRIGTELEIGAMTGKLMGKDASNFYLASGFQVGFQYPWRLTPFVDFRAAAGIIAGDAASKNAITSMWLVGLDFGVEIYLVDRSYLSASIGWVHPVYRGVDLDFLTANPTRDPTTRDISTDTWTIKLGIGL